LLVKALDAVMLSAAFPNTSIMLGSAVLDGCSAAACKPICISTPCTAAFVGSVSRFTTFVPDVVALRALCGTPLLARACDREQSGNL